MTKEAREKNRQSHLANYKSGKRIAVFKGQKRPDHAIVMKGLYLRGKWVPPSLKNENNPAWKGDDASYSAFHHWLGKHKERKYWCYIGDHKIIKKSEFANVSGIHTHNADDYVEACTSCHRNFDYNRPLFFEE